MPPPKKGTPAWDIFIEKQRASHLGKYDGEKNPNFGKTHSAETRAKISAALEGHPISEETKSKLSVIRKELWANNTMRKKEHADRARKRVRTEEERQKISETKLINGHDIWYGGVTYKEPQVNKYCHKWNPDLRRRIRECWDYKSVLSGKTKTENGNHQLSCHHVFYQPLACCTWDEDHNGYFYYIDGEKYYIKGEDPNKFVLLTKTENTMVNFDKLKWIKIFEDIIEKHGGICYMPKEE
jgi:hypothetical protein